jgi:hypothetical protein
MGKKKGKKCRRFESWHNTSNTEFKIEWQKTLSISFRWIIPSKTAKGNENRKSNYNCTNEIQLGEMLSLFGRFSLFLFLFIHTHFLYDMFWYSRYVYRTQLKNVFFSFFIFSENFVCRSLEEFFLASLKKLFHRDFICVHSFRDLSPNIVKFYVHVLSSLSLSLSDVDVWITKFQLSGF